MGIVVKLKTVLEDIIHIVEDNDIQCKCVEGHMCKLCEARAILKDVNRMVASGGIEGVRPRKQVYCITTDRTFGSLKEASEAYGIVSATISKCCKGTLKFGGKFGGQKLQWRYVEEEK